MPVIADEGPTPRRGVHVTKLPSGNIAVSHASTPEVVPLVFTAESWDGFTKGVKAGKFDRDKL